MVKQRVLNASIQYAYQLLRNFILLHEKGAPALGLTFMVRPDLH